MAGIASCRFRTARTIDCAGGRYACTSLRVWPNGDGHADGDCAVRRRRGTDTFCGSSHAELEHATHPGFSSRGRQLLEPALLRAEPDQSREYHEAGWCLVHARRRTWSGRNARRHADRGRRGDVRHDRREKRAGHRREDRRRQVAISSGIGRRQDRREQRCRRRRWQSGVRPARQYAHGARSANGSRRLANAHDHTAGRIFFGSARLLRWARVHWRRRRRRRRSG